MSMAWRRLLTLLLALLLPLQGLARPCDAAGHGTSVPCAAAAPTHGEGHGAGRHHAEPVTDASHEQRAATSDATPCGDEGHPALQATCSVCAACCVGLALPSAAPALATPAPSLATALPVLVPVDAGVPARLDRPPQGAAT